MLSELYIKNFALIDELYLEPGDGLNVITGETGAGKSIILGALAAAVGEKTDPQVIRKGADKATVEAVFDLSDSPDTREKLGEQTPPAKYFLDETPSADTNEIAIYWNSPAIFVGAYFNSLI